MYICGPSALGPYPVTNRDYGFKIVMIDEPFNLAGAFSLNYPEFPDSCRGLKLPLLVNIYKMLIHRFNGNLVKLSDELLGEPCRLPFNANLDLRLAILAFK